MGYSQNKKATDSIKVAKSDTIQLKDRDTENRNVMLNAGANVGPRNVNIGLPFDGDIAILENSLPVVNSFWPQNPLTVWRYDSSIGNIGLLSYSETAITTGKLGYAVDSYDRFVARNGKFKGYISSKFNHFGLNETSANISSSIGDRKNGWGYTLSTYQMFDPASYTLGFSQQSDRTQFYKLGISKKLKTGTLQFLYSYKKSRSVQSVYQPFMYKGNGETEQLDNFELGLDSYIVQDGLIPFYDKLTGEKRFYDMNSDDIAAITHSIDVLGDFKLKNNWKLNFATRFMKSKAPMSIQFPVTSTLAEDIPASGMSYTLLGNSAPYEGNVQQVSSYYIDPTDITTIMSRLELAGKKGSHDIKLGLQQQYYREDIFKLNTSVYYQTIEPQPKKLTASAYIPAYGMYVPITDEDGIIKAASGGSDVYREDSYLHKLAVYGLDTWAPSNKLDVILGGRIERFESRGKMAPYQDEIVYQDIDGNGIHETKRPLKDFTQSEWNVAGTASFIYKTFNRAGISGEFTYNEIRKDFGSYNSDYSDYIKNKNPILFGSAGVYFNHPLFNVVSKLTYISKRDNVRNIVAYNPSNPSETNTIYPIFYDIETFGWTTDILSNPFKNFDIHFLVTLQNPIYKNFSYDAFGQNYSYDNKNIPELSKVLLEIDPSYKLFNQKVKLWASLRYFGKQYSTLSNALYYNGWWETFAGIDYTYRRKLDLKLDVTNFLNQYGVKGSIIGGELITDSNAYDNKILTGSYIRPFTVSVSVNYKF
ncbi:2,6-beta-D-fructofuranosidase [Neptunitalea sp. Y10]|uniref:2,6-beta-D-fructofuranosidase n=1 Tax=Neptunitalea lumnitzerae TaxID=2965509 RepID=A0ABQ5MJI3_9FLAO|nr:2,6-beta-D-fructofuranosidase [Neptunitalea sp. Y10]